MYEYVVVCAQDGVKCEGIRVIYHDCLVLESRKVLPGIILPEYSYIDRRMGC